MAEIEALASLAYAHVPDYLYSAVAAIDSDELYALFQLASFVGTIAVDFYEWREDYRIDVKDWAVHLLLDCFSLY